MEMNKLKSYEEYSLNEELGKKTLAAGLVGLGIAAGAITLGNKGILKNINWSGPDTESSWSPTSKSAELPNKFTLTKEIISIGTVMDIKDANGNDLGKIDEKILSIGKTFEYLDANGNLIAKAHQKPLNLYTVIKISDARGTLIGSLEQEVLESLVSVYNIYSIKDATGRVIAKSKKLNLFTKTVEIYDTNGNIVVFARKKIISLTPEYDITISGNIDKRLVVFIGAFLTTAEDKD